MISFESIWRSLRRSFCSAIFFRSPSPLCVRYFFCILHSKSTASRDETMIWQKSQYLCNGWRNEWFFVSAHFHNREFFVSYLVSFFASYGSLNVFMETMTTTAALTKQEKIIKNYRIMMLSMSLIKALFLSIVAELGKHWTFKWREMKWNANNGRTHKALRTQCTKHWQTHTHTQTRKREKVMSYLNMVDVFQLSFF